MITLIVIQCALTITFIIVMAFLIVNVMGLRRSSRETMAACRELEAKLQALLSGKVMSAGDLLDGTITVDKIAPQPPADIERWFRNGGSGYQPEPKSSRVETDRPHE